MTTFDPTKPVKTRHGWEARIVSTDLHNHKALWEDGILAVLSDPETGLDVVATYTPKGSYGLGRADDLDLINVPEKYVRWMNIYPNGGGGMHGGRLYKSREHAGQYGNEGLIARVRIEFEEGEGLE